METGRPFCITACQRTRMLEYPALWDSVAAGKSRPGRKSVIIVFMTTINTIEDLIKLLDENPQWVEALRKRLLPQELIELPEKFAQFAAAANQRFDKLDAAFEGLRGDVGQLQGDVGQLQGNVGQLQVDVSQLQTSMARVENTVQRLLDDVGVLKGAYARNAAHNQPDLIAAELGFTYVHTLTPGEIYRLSRESDTTGIPANQLRSFWQADLIMAATDQNGADCYLAVEVSYTVDERDTTRAVRNAEFLTRFTGRRAYAGVAGLRRDQRIRLSIESGEVFWYEMMDDGLEAE